MSVQLTPNGTRGITVPKLPGPLWRVIQAAMSAFVKLRGGDMLLLTTVGSKTGQERTVTLRWFPNGKNSWYIIASFGGATKHPAWYVNMAKNPDKIWVQMGGEKFRVRAESLHGTERDQVWEHVVKEAPGYGTYQTNTDREIPIIRLTRV